MNYRKKEMMKNIIYITFILSIAIISTYIIYHKFQDNRDIDFSSQSLDVVYHEATGDKIALTKVIPVTDSVGLSSKSYSVSVQNNLTENVEYSIKILDDMNTILEDDCGEYLIPKDDLRISVKLNKDDNEIYDFNELEDGVLIHHEIGALETDTILIRIWTKQDSTLPRGAKMHYHGILQLVEENSSVALSRE